MLAETQKVEYQKRFEQLLTDGVPTRKNENYRYTHLRNLDWERTSEAVSTECELPEMICVCESERAHSACYASHSKNLDLRSHGEEGFEWFSLAENKSPLSRALAPSLEDDLLVHYNLARGEQGIGLVVEKDQKLAVPFRAVHYFSDQTKTFFPRVQIVAEEGSQFTWVDEYLGKGMRNGVAAFCCGLVQIELKKGAKVKYVLSQNWEESVDSFTRFHFHLEEDAELEIVGLSTGSNRIQNRIEVDCEGARSKVTLNSAVFSRSSQKIDYWMTARHPNVDSSSELNHTAIAAEKSTAIFNGNIIIPRTGLRTEAQQSNRNVLLSKDAVIDTVPKLEIATDEVKCGHGATTTPVDEEQVMYLRSRGISEDEARRMILTGFLQPIWDRVPLKSTQTRWLDGIAVTGLKFQTDLEEWSE